MFPQYLAMGMTYDQFWNDDVNLVKFYRKAWRIKRELREEELWLQGAYVYEAILDASPFLRPFPNNGTKPEPYCKEPYGYFGSHTKKEKEDSETSEMEKMKASLQAWAIETNKRFERKGGEKDGK